MKKVIGLVGAAVLAVGCGHMRLDLGGPQIVGSGKKATETRKVGAFKRLDVAGSMDVEVVCGSQADAKIEGDDNILPLLKTEVTDGTLRLSVDGSYSTKNPIKVVLGTTMLEAAELSGSGDVLVKNATGSKLDLALSGSGDITVAGSADKLEANISGSGSLHLEALTAKDAEVTITGSGEADVSVKGDLSANVTGSGNVHYHGKPAHIQSSVTGSGTISAK